MGGPEKPSSPVEEGSKRSASRANDEDEDGQILKSQGWPETTDHSNSTQIPHTCLKTCFFSKQELQCILWWHIHICTWKSTHSYMYLEVLWICVLFTSAQEGSSCNWQLLDHFFGMHIITVGYTSYSIVLMGCPPKLDLANPMDDHSRRFLMAYKRGHLWFLNKSMPHSC